MEAILYEQPLGKERNLSCRQSDVNPKMLTPGASERTRRRLVPGFQIVGGAAFIRADTGEKETFFL